TGAPERPPLAVADPLWWPPVKIVGRYLAPFLASIAELETPPELPPVAPSGLDIEIELEPETLQKLPGARLRFEADDGEDEWTAGTAMTPNLVVAAPEDTLGEVAEMLLTDPSNAAVVSEFGTLVGILTTADLVRASAARVHPSEARVRQWMTAQ